MSAVTEIRRKLTLRCEHCGKRFHWKRDPRFSFGDGKEVYHEFCMAYLSWRRKAAERLDVLRVVLDVAALDARTVKGVIEMRAANDTERIARSNEAFRVFYDLDKEGANE